MTTTFKRGRRWAILAATALGIVGCTAARAGEPEGSIVRHGNLDVSDTAEYAAAVHRAHVRSYRWEAYVGLGFQNDAARYAAAVVEAEQARAAEAAVTRPSSSSSYSGGNSGTSWDAVAQCESGGNWAINTGNGYYGGLQFDTQTWDAYGNPAYGQANEAPMSEQVAAANRMPYDGWPSC